MSDKQKRPRGSGSIFKQKGSRFLWVCYYSNGKAVRESCGSEKKTDAQNLLRRRMAEAQNGTLVEPKVRRVTIDELYADEIADLEKRHKQTAWLKPCWELRLKEFFSGRPACQIRRADLEAYQSHRMNHYRAKFPDASEKKISACETAVNTDLAVLRMILYRGHALEKLQAVPPFPPKLQGAMERSGTITAEQFVAMLASCENDEDWLRAMLTMAYTWGYRLRELTKMRCIQVSLDERVVYLFPRTTKNKKARSIPISDDEIGPLRICVWGKNPEDRVLTRRDGSAVEDMRARWDKLVTNANAGHMEINERGERVWVKAIFHDFRRTAATNLLAGGMSPANVRAIVGHLSEEMTARYNKPAMDTLRATQQKGAALLASFRPALPSVTHSSYIVALENDGDAGKESALELLESTI